MNRRSHALLVAASLMMIAATPAYHIAQQHSSTGPRQNRRRKLKGWQKNRKGKR